MNLMEHREQPDHTVRSSRRTMQTVLRWVLTAAAAIACCVCTLYLLSTVLLSTGFSLNAPAAAGTNAVVMDRYDTYITNALSDSLEGVVTIRKEYWLSDEDMIAPRPDPACFGETDDPATLQWLLEDAQRLLGITDTLFSTDKVIKPGSLVKYYLDETIFMVAWQEVIDNGVYSFSEVKIAHPSQFRRFLADGTYGSDKQYLTTEMASSVNAVVAASGDFYKFRGMGVIVYNGTVQRANSYLDVCYIDGTGDLLFSRVGELGDMESARQFVEQHDVRFSLAFGPVLVDNYQRVVPTYYQLGEVDRNYSRAALAQLGECHYLMVTVNYDGYYHVPSIYQLADRMVDLGVEKAYALDGGQTATMVVNNTLFNKPDYGTQRKISDIIYFATAVPEDD